MLLAAYLPATAEERRADDVRALMQQASRQQLADEPRWQALLHLERGQPRIEDAGFLLSARDFTPQRELDATLQHLYGGNADAVCRFPARHAWLSTRLPVPPLDLTHCSHLQEFLARAPARTVALAFASEHIAQPASMMGHVFLVLQGEGPQGQPLAHAVSFYTDADTFNLPKLFFESLVTGKEGLFSLSPYDEVASQYLRRERRALWTFPLGLDPTERTLVLYHLHELRWTRFRYYFQGYNCATLVKHVLAVARPEILERHDPWTTPGDVVRDADAAGLVVDASVEAPPRWRIGLLRDALSRPLLDRVQSAVRDGTVVQPQPAPSGLLMLELQRAYLADRLDPRTALASQQLADVERALNEGYPGQALEIAPSRDPRRAPGDTQISFGWATVGHDRYARLDLLPISHHLEDRRPPANAETALSLLELSLLQPLAGGTPRLHRLSLYAIESLLPYDGVAGGLSGKFRLGIDDEDPAWATRRLHGWIGGALGGNWRAQRDIDLYALGGAGLYGRSGWQVRTSQEAGIVVREAFGLKSVVSLTAHQHPREPQRRSRVWRWVQSVPLGGSWSIVIDARHIEAGPASRDEGSALLRRVF